METEYQLTRWGAVRLHTRFFLKMDCDTMLFITLGTFLCWNANRCVSSKIDRIYSKWYCHQIKNPTFLSSVNGCPQFLYLERWLATKSSKRFAIKQKTVSVDKLWKHFPYLTQNRHLIFSNPNKYIKCFFDFHKKTTKYEKIFNT